MAVTSCYSLEGISKMHLMVFKGVSSERYVHFSFWGHYVLDFVYIVCACSIKSPCIDFSLLSMVRLLLFVGSQFSLLLWI